MGNFGMRLRAKQQLQTGARNWELPGVAASAASRTRARGAIQRCQLVGEGEKIEKVVRFGAFWCMTCGTARQYTAYGVRRAVWKDVLRKKNVRSDAFDAFTVRAASPDRLLHSRTRGRSIKRSLRARLIGVQHPEKR